MHITSEQKSAVLSALIAEGYLSPGDPLIDVRHDAVFPDRVGGNLGFSFVIGDQVDQLVSGSFDPDGNVVDLAVTEIGAPVTEALLATIYLMEAARS